jgi:hypothetical protein
MDNALDGMGDLFLVRSFQLQVFLFSTIFFGGEVRSYIFCFGHLLLDFSSLVLLLLLHVHFHLHLVSDI